MGKYLTELHPQYTLFAEESHYTVSMPNFAKVVLLHFTSNFNYLQHFQKEISPKTWVSCEVLYQAYNIFPFPIVKAN